MTNSEKVDQVQKQIVVLHPSLAGSRAARLRLEEAGYIVIVGEASQLSVVVPRFVGLGDAVSRAALDTIATADANTKAQFGMRVAKALAAETP